MNRFVVSSMVGLVACVSMVACSSTSEPGPGGPPPSPSVVPPSAGVVKQTGTIVDFDTKHPIGGATVTAGDQTATTDAQGHYTLTLKKDQPFALKVTAPTYVTVVEQQTSISKDYERGQTFLLAMDDANLMRNILRNDSSLSLLSVAILPTGACKSVAGAKIKVEAGADDAKVKVKYFTQGQPSNVLDAAEDGAFPTAVIYDFTPGAAITITVDSPSCTQAAYPFVTDQGITYLGTVETDPSGDETASTTSFQRIFLQ